MLVFRYQQKKGTKVLETRTVIIGEIRHEITNSCICENYNEETNTYSPADSCYGCWSDEVSNFDYEIIKPWRDANGFDEDTNIRVDFNRVNWNGVSGYGIVKATASWVISAISINTDWRVVFTLNGKALTATRYSHDEPVGTGLITFNLFEREED